MDRKKQTGFTLIELIIVIIILAILVAFAIPKYMSLDRTARINVASGLQGALRSASALVRIVGKTTGTISTGNVTIDNTVTPAVVVTVSNTTGYPTATAAGITAALESIAGFTPSYVGAVATYQLASTTGTCTATYDTSTVPPTISGNTAGC